MLDSYDILSRVLSPATRQPRCVRLYRETVDMAEEISAYLATQGIQKRPSRVMSDALSGALSGLMDEGRLCPAPYKVRPLTSLRDEVGSTGMVKVGVALYPREWSQLGQVIEVLRGSSLSFNRVTRTLVHEAIRQAHDALTD